MSAGHHSHDHGPKGAPRRALTYALVLTVSFTIVEVIGGLVTGSLALLADAAHMMSDNISIALALVAAWLATKPPTSRSTFGYKRAEILAALANGITLVAVSIWIFVEATRRFDERPEILGTPMLVVAVIGLAVNATAVWILARSRSGSLNAEAAYRHVLADAAGSVGVIVAAVLVLVFDWAIADPIVSIVIAVLVLLSSWRVLRESTRVLLEAAPEGLDVEAIGARMVRIPGVVEVHDLHVWTITSGFPALSAHVLVAPEADGQVVRRALAGLLEAEFQVGHSTLQIHTAVSGAVFVPLEQVRAAQADAHGGDGHDHDDDR